MISSTITVLVSIICFSIVFGNDDLLALHHRVLPSLGLGTAGLGGKTYDVVYTALVNGVRLIDTAQAKEWYDERVTGEAARAFAAEYPDAKLFVVTKIHPRDYSLNLMREALRMSAQNFEGIGLHTVLLHAPFCWRGHCNEDMVPWQQAWRNLELLKDEMNIPNIGVSNFDLPLMEELIFRVANRRVAIIQNWMDPLHQDGDVRRLCSEHNIQYMAYSSFGTQWQFSSKVRSGVNPVLDNEVLSSIAMSKGWSVSQLILSWLLLEDVVAVPRSSRAEHLSENFHSCQHSKRCVEWVAPSLTEAGLTELELEQIRSLDNLLGNPWD